MWFCGIMEKIFVDMLKKKGYVKRFNEIRNKLYGFPDLSSGNGCRATINEIFPVKIGDTML